MYIYIYIRIRIILAIFDTPPPVHPSPPPLCALFWYPLRSNNSLSFFIVISEVSGVALIPAIKILIFTFFNQLIGFQGLIII